MNICIITGHLGNDPESFFTPEGVHIVSFQIAFRSSKDKTNWIRVTCFNKVSEIAEKHLHKGAKIAVNGNLIQDNWTTQEGQHRSAFKLIANTIEFIKTDGRGFEKNENQNDSSSDGDVPVNETPPDDDQFHFRK